MMATPCRTHIVTEAALRACAHTRTAPLRAISMAAATSVSVITARSERLLRGPVSPEMFSFEQIHAFAQEDPAGLPDLVGPVGDPGEGRRLVVRQVERVVVAEPAADSDLGAVGKIARTGQASGLDLVTDDDVEAWLGGGRRQHARVAAIQRELGVAGGDEHVLFRREAGEVTVAGGVGIEGWHTDGAYDQEPFKATQLYALAVPSRGGDTCFASMYAAYDALPPRLRERLEGRTGAFTYGGRRKATALLDEADRDWTPVHHPIIRTHPETGRRGLYFDPGKILRIEGLEAAESDDLIEELTGRMIQPEGEYRHRRRKGDVVIWDNRCSYHKAAGDYPPEEDRIHWRVSIKEVA
jgi:Taurine catabolism dioxygenase TauD, TfdA family